MNKANSLRSSSVFAMSALLSMGVSTTAFAAEQSGGADAANVQAGALEIGDIIVTAQRREQRLQDVPIAVTALSGGALKSAGIAGSEQLTQVTPGLVFSNATIFAQPVIRGIGASAASSGDESNVATYVDGVYMPKQIGNFYRFNSIERIEVLKGPQGTLFGRNATGGAISITTRAPSAQPVLELDGEYGRFNRASLKGYASGGLGDKVAADIAVSYDRMPNIFTLIPQNRTPITAENVGVRAKIVITPTEEFKLVLAADYASTNDASSLMFQPEPGTKPLGASPPFNAPIATGDYNFSLNNEPKLDVEQYGGSLTAVYEAGWGTITSLSSYRYGTNKSLSDFDLTIVPLVLIDQNMRDRTFQQELRFGSAGDGPFNWLAGVYYFNDTAFYEPLSFNPGTPGVSAIRTKLKTQAFAGYADGTYDLSDQWSFTAGLRFSSETKKFVRGSVNGFQVINGLKANWKDVSPRAIISYKPNSSNLIYLSFSKGFKSGQFNTVSLQATPVDPEKLMAYEAGWKLTIARRATLNSSIFYYDYTNFQTQIFDPARGVTLLNNAQAARTYGFDVQLMWQVQDNFKLSAGAAYLNAKFKDFRNAPITVPSPTGFGNVQVIRDLKGFSMARAPRLTANLGGDYTVDLGGNSGSLVFSANGYASSKYYWDVGNRVTQKSYMVANAQVEWRSVDGHWAVRAFGRNITDERYGRFRSATALGDSYTAADPVTYGVGLRLKY